MALNTNDARPGADGVVVRHKVPDRLLHWTSAACVLILMATGFLPILGIEFEWVTIHWITGLTLLAALSVHISRTFSREQFMAMWFGFQDIKLALPNAEKPGKYSPAQKLMHLGVAALVVATIITGLIMMVKIDTPLWERNIYLLGDGTWGVIYVVHGLAALTLITTVMLHIYFALRPEKLMYTRSMIKGWLTRDEFNEYHDAKKWQVDDSG